MYPSSAALPLTVAADPQLAVSLVLAGIGVLVGIGGALWGLSRGRARGSDPRAGLRGWLVAGWVAFGLVFWFAWHVLPAPWGPVFGLLYAPALILGIRWTNRLVRAVEQARGAAADSRE